MNQNQSIVKLTQGGIIAVLAFVSFQFFRISTPVATIHFGNSFIIIGALLLGGFYGGVAGAVGLTISDILSGYASDAPATFLCKVLIGVIVGIISHKICHINQAITKKKRMVIATISSVVALFINIFSDTFIRWAMNILMYGMESAKVLAIKNLLGSSINLVLGTLVAVILYMVIEPALKKAGLLTGN